MSTICLFNRCCLQKIRPMQSLLLTNFVIGRHHEQRCDMKHWKPKFKWFRTRKVIKVDIPDYHAKTKETKDETKRRMRERGVMPPRPWMERTFCLPCTSENLDPYVPPEGDGKRSMFSKSGAMQNVEFLGKKSKSMMAIRKIRSYDEDFSPKDFAVKAQEIYCQAHEALMAKDKYLLRQFVTERAYGEMMHNVSCTTIRWKFLRSLEPPRVVHARQTHMISQENIFAQVSVRLFTQQTLAIYDRFGRLMHGSEIIAKDVLEYVVFESNVSNAYGSWRLHSKIIPDWAEPKAPSFATWRVIEEEPEETAADESAADKSQEAAVETVQIAENSSKPPPVSIA